MTDFNLTAEEAAIVEKVRDGLVSIRKTKAKPAYDFTNGDAKLASYLNLPTSVDTDELLDRLTRASSAGSHICTQEGPQRVRSGSYVHNTHTRRSACTRIGTQGLADIPLDSLVFARLLLEPSVRALPGGHITYHT